MCGICGTVGLADRGQDSHHEDDNQDHLARETDLTREMKDSLQLINHRGPDSNGTWISPDQRIGAAFSHKSLATGHANDRSTWP